MSIFAWLVVGLIAGYLGSLVVNRSGEGMIRDILLGIVGAFVGGFIAGNSGDGLTGSHTLKLTGTKQAPGALASLVITNADAAGNWPMQLSVTGLPKLPTHGYYEVFVTRNGKPWAPCGVFIVKSATGAVSVRLNAPYEFRRGDGWVVTKQLPGHHEAGPVVLKLGRKYARLRP